MKKLLAVVAVLGLFVVAASIVEDEINPKTLAETCHKTGQPPKDTMFVQTQPSSEDEHPC